jgi:pimeloyl-ACP methyl ester carboxylesterase
VGRPVQPVPDVRPAGFADPPPGGGLDRYRGQRPSWRPCGRLRCAQILVPLDYAHPDDAAITLTVGLLPASGTARATVFANPGGPGGSGLRFLQGMDQSSWTDVDLISWDPRGVGASTPVGCWGDAASDAYSQLDLSPDDTAERTALVDGAQRLGLSCLNRSGALLEHLSTADSARDLDLIRDALGLPRANYLGLSNGTLIGAIYAQLFPNRVGRFVLDGAVNISHSPVLQLQGFDRALTAMADWCVAQPSGCPLGTSRVEVLGAITGLWRRLETKPLTVGGRTLTQTKAAIGVLQSLYGGEAGYSNLIAALGAAISRGDPTGLLSLSDRLLGRQPDGHWSQFTYAYPASRCADAPNTGLSAAWADAALEARRAPIFGPVIGADVECAVWPVDAPASVRKLTAPKAPPLVVIGTTGDPATPYEWAQGMAQQLQSAVLVTHRGTGHTAFGSACYPSVVRPYLLDGRLPPPGTTC